MGKEGELWDDSALVKAFDNAMSKYKKMHCKKKYDDNQTAGENDIKNVSDYSHANQEDNRCTEAEETKPNSEPEISEAKNVSSSKHVPSEDSHAPEPNFGPSNGNMQDSLQGGLYSQGSDGYNQLLTQYYELEEKRQQILQQLNQIGGWNYQYSGQDPSSAAQWSNCSTSQHQHPLPETQASHSVVVSSCCPYACPYFATPCTTYPSCSTDSACIGKTCSGMDASVGCGKSPSVVNDDIVKTAMAAAERAISSMRTKTSAGSDVNEDGEKKEAEGKAAENITSETDLSVVLNAWYSTGFYTCKYLTEQSIAKKRNP